MRSISGLMFGCAALLLSPAALAVRCGEVLTRSVALIADLRCSGPAPALTIAASGVVIYFNGHTIYGNATGFAPGNGIVVQDVSSVTLQGPGQLYGFHNAVHAERADYLTVTDIKFGGSSLDDVRSGISLFDSRYAAIGNNRFDFNADASGSIPGEGVRIWHRDSARVPGAGQHRIFNNQFVSAGNAIAVCGAEAGRNRIEDNRFSRAVSFAVIATDQADGNTIQRNTFELRGGMVGLDSSGNRVLDNHFSSWPDGIVIFGMGPSALCFTRARTIDMTDNWIFRNSFYGTRHGIVLGHGPYVVGDSLIQKNTFYIGEVGIDFGPNARWNYARPNTFTEIARPVIDAGVGNVY